jgi:hypothetical protein
MLFGRCFKLVVAALFRHEDPAAALLKRAPCKNLELAWMGGPSTVDVMQDFLNEGAVTAFQYCGTSRFKPSIIPKCLRLLVTNVSPSSIAMAAMSESKTCRP